VQHVPQRNQFYLDCKRPTPFFTPRFWRQGWLIDHCPKPYVDYQPYDLSAPPNALPAHK
jgi:hypothetical protein